MNIRPIYHLRIAAACGTGITLALPKRVLPVLANINLTENCNARCVTCDYWRKRWDDAISTDRAVRLLNELVDLGVRNVRFTGGDPLTRRDLLEVLATRNRSDFDKVVLATNGLLLKHYAGAVNDSIISHVTVSLDALKEKNDEIRGIRGYFDKALDGLALLKGKTIKIVSTLSNALAPDLDGLIALCKERGYRFDVNLPDSNMYFFVSRETKASLQTLKPSPTDLARMFDVLERAGILSGVVLQNARSYMETGKFNFKHCPQGFIEVNIDSAGSVRTGCNVFEPVGNILKTPLADVMASDPYRASVEKMFRFDCPGCTCGYGISASYSAPHRVGTAYISKRLR